MCVTVSELVISLLLRWLKASLLELGSNGSCWKGNLEVLACG